LLDGVEELHKVVFIATTNYPERLEDRIINRPSRFDIRIKVDRPAAEARRLYLESLLHEDDSIDVASFVRDTDGLSLAHVKELFIAVHILGGDYREAVARIQSMQSESVSSAED